jgi:hypothetical protein
MKILLLTTIATVVLVETVFADPIHTAAKNGDPAAVQAELDKGVDVNASGNGQSPLHLAAIMGHVEVTELLIASGADLKGTDKHGNTPLHYTAHHGSKETAKLLIIKGADLNVKRDDGNTPLDNATKYKHTEIIELLRKHGGKTSAELALIPRLNFIRSPFGFTFNTIEGKTYRVESGMDLKKWNKIREIKGTGNEAKFIDMRRIYFPQHFYRLMVVD